MFVLVGRTVVSVLLVVQYDGFRQVLTIGRNDLTGKGEIQHP